MEQHIVASVHKHRRSTLERVEKYISHNQFKDINLRGRLFLDAKPVDKLLHFVVPGGPAAWEDWPFSRVAEQCFHPVQVGQTFGPLWSTHWFRVQVAIPESWVGQEVWLHWVSDAEAMLWSKDGEPLQGFSPGGRHLSPLKGARSSGDSEPDQSRTDCRVHQCWRGSRDPLLFYVEMACNGMFGAGADGMISSPDQSRTFKVEAVEVSIRNPQVFKLLNDLEVLHDLAKCLPLEDPRGHQALHTANYIINIIINGDYRKASEVADSFFANKNGDLAHTLALIGNCHIDSAWLWPYSETKRKCARSWCSTLALMDEYPELIFACSQAQQLLWVKTHYPSLFERIATKVKAGRFIPVGGTWVEMDGLIPSGESFMRQFLYGQLFFMKEFGVQCREFWLPDTFGYSAQFPQICQHFGINRFLTQKMSWSLVNKFPHHNFIWEGLDGSTVLSHFTPGDSYELRIRVQEALHAVKNLEDKGRVSTSAFLYGHGDGGGGPTRNMLERSRRLRDVDGCPRMEHMTPNSFFERIEAEQHNLCRWVGELYLELHNGTYTTQAHTKQQNRVCESALHDAELLLVVALLIGGMKREDALNHHTQLTEAWKKVLLNQFHDVIPGTSIGIVYKDADCLYREALSCAKEVMATCYELIFKDGEEEAVTVAVNTLPWHVMQVMLLDQTHDRAGNLEPRVKASRVEGKAEQAAGKDQHYVVMHAAGMGWGRRTASLSPAPVTVATANNTFTLENEHIRAEVDRYGQVKSLRMNRSGQDVFQQVRSPGLQQQQQQHGSARWSSNGRGNQVVMFDDIPLYWDAWDVMDYHLETGRVLNTENNEHVVKEVEVVESGPLMAKLRWTIKISEESTLTQEIELSAVSHYLTFKCHVNWHENRKCLKVAFDTTLTSRVASFDTQFGFIERPTHTNTSWDSAKFEVCGHKWADLSEHGLGLAVLNDCKYGWTARGSMLMLSLLRSPKAPDADCDMGTHTFAYALMPHRGNSDRGRVQRAAYEFNNSLTVTSASVSSGLGDTWFDLEGEGAMIEAVKLAEDGSGDVVVRIYETLGSRTLIKLQVPSQAELNEAVLCSGLEEPLEAVPILREAHSQQCVELQLLPFKIVSVRLSFTYNSS